MVNFYFFSKPSRENFLIFLLLVFLLKRIVESTTQTHILQLLKISAGACCAELWIYVNDKKG